MKVTLPEKIKLRKRDIAIYSTIIMVCIISIIVAFYVQFYARIDILGLSGNSELGKKSEEEKEILKSEFDDLFTNNITEDIEGSNKKQDATRALVYTEYEKKESKLNSYDVEVHIPHINIDNEIIDEYNEEIENVFMKRTENVLQSENRNVIYTVEYIATVQDDILSLMIRSNLKEGSSAQRVIIQTYNYDLRNNKEITLAEVLKIENIQESDVENQIIETIQIEQSKVEALRDLGYNIYSRNIRNDMYKIENATEYYLTGNTLYIIFAYGNETSTSEMDLVVL